MFFQINTNLKFSYFLGEAGVRVLHGIGQSRIRHSASNRVADGVDEAGLSSSDGPIQKNSEMFNVLIFRLIIFHILKILLFVSVKKY